MQIFPRKRMYKHMIKMWGMAKYTGRGLPTDGLYGHRLLKGKKHSRPVLPHRKSWGAQEYFNKSLPLHDRPLSSQTREYRQTTSIGVPLHLTSGQRR
jgi:hypothetical protein